MSDRLYDQERLRRVWIGLLLLVLLLAGYLLIRQLFWVSRVSAAGPYTVNASSDAPDATLDGVCATAGGQCTLRAAMEEAINDGGGTILFDTTLFTTPQTIVLTARLPELTADVSIEGPGEELLTIDGDDQYRHFTIAPGTTVEISGMTLVRGFSGTVVDDKNGGAINNAGTLTLRAMTIANSRAPIDAPFGFGGGIFNESNAQLTLEGLTMYGNQAFRGGAIYADFLSTTTIRDSRIGQVASPNIAGSGGGGIFNGGTLTLSGIVAYNQSLEEAGGGIYNYFGTAIIENSSIVANQLAGGFSAGGGIANTEGATLALSNSTVSGNQAQGDGGGISFTEGASGTITNTTIVENIADSEGDGSGDGGGIYGDNLSGAPAPEITISNTIIANNSANTGRRDCYLSADPFSDITLTSGGHNLVEAPGNCTSFDNALNDITGGDPQLAALADNGGNAPTHLLLASSPAIDAGSTTACPPVDQRGVPRPIDGDGSGGAVCDIGAVEVDVASPGASATLSDAIGPGGADYTFTVVYTDNVAIDVSSLDDSDVRVSGPNGFDQLASLVSVSDPGDGAPRSATYRIEAPGGNWDAADNGDYTLLLEAGQVFDTSTPANGAPAGALGSFTVDLSGAYMPLVRR